MIKFMQKFWRSYLATMMEENSWHTERYEVRPGVYSSLNPAMLLDVGAADFDLAKVRC